MTIRRVFVACLLLSACQSSSAIDAAMLPDLSASDLAALAADLARSVDMTGRPADLASAGDIAAPRDLSSPPDLSSNADLASPPDLVTPPDLFGDLAAAPLIVASLTLSCVY